MVSVCLPSDALLQHLPSYLGFSYLGRGVSLHSCSSKAQPLLLTWDEGYLITAALPDLQHGIAPLGPPAPGQPQLLGCGVGPPGRRPWPRAWGRQVASPGHRPDLRCGVAPLGQSCALSAYPTQSRVDSITGVTLTIIVKFAHGIPFVHDSQPAF